MTTPDQLRAALERLRAYLHKIPDAVTTLDEAIAALSTPAARMHAGEGEAVAWLYEHAGMERRKIKWVRDSDPAWLIGNGWTETPLYAHQPQPAGEAVQMADRWAGVPELVDKITAEEGATVTFTGPNPDFNGLPNEAVTVCRGDDWQDVTYRADTLADCLRAALQSGEEKT